MSFTYCEEEDLKKVSVGQELKMNGRYEDLKKEDGADFDFVARKDDVVVVQSKTDSYLVVRFYEDTVRLRRNERENYGEFVVKPQHIQKFD